MIGKFDVDFVFHRSYRGPIRLAVFDWAGTTVDYGCMAPVAAFVETFKRRGVQIGPAEARAPMGLAKKDHIAAIARQPAVAERWQHVLGRSCTEADVTEIQAGKGPSKKRKKTRTTAYQKVETIDQVGRLIQTAEKRFLGCLSGLAKKSEMMSLELQMQDVQTEVRELRRRGSGGKTPRTPQDPYANLLKPLDLKKLEKIQRMQSSSS